jgi:hypothetical protein
MWSEYTDLGERAGLFFCLCFFVVSIWAVLLMFFSERHERSGFICQFRGMR